MSEFYNKVNFFLNRKYIKLKSEFSSLNFPKIRKGIKYLAVLNLTLLIFVLYESLFAKNYWTGADEKRFKIEHGRNLDQIIYGLRSDDVIKSPLIFKILSKVTGKENVIISRSYLIRNGISNLELLHLLTDPYAYELIRFTVPAGYTIRRISRLVEQKLFLSAEKFMDETVNDSLLAIIGMNEKVKNLEGFLFPDTYNVISSMNEEDIIHMMFDAFRKKIYENPRIRNEIEHSGKNLLEVITIASIIEGETRIENEKPVISGVYHNRLRRGMRLQADPTIQYALPGGHKSRLLYEDLKIESPYNTYLYSGLPPGPISNPGLSAIKAAVSPDQHDYLFFVATGDGGHKFTRNYQEHLNAVRDYRIKLRQLNQQKNDTTVNGKK
jgi:UPF0755 protein